MASRNYQRPIPGESFQQEFERKLKNNEFLQEFEELKQVGNNQPKVEAELPANAAKNRYPYILPYDHSRVKLTLTDGDPHSGYINANYIPGFRADNEYIATQAPTQASLVDFWRMTWEQRVKNIVMLTVCEEEGKKLCDQYWPSDSASYGPFKVFFVAEDPCKDWTKRHFKLQHVVENQVRHIFQMHYGAWPDRGVPQSPASLVTFVEIMRSQISAKEYGPTVLHCSAGVGRTGTLIALDVALQMLRAEGYVDVYGTVYQMRSSRVMMLQTVEQYIFVHRCILETISQMGKENFSVYCEQRNSCCDKDLQNDHYSPEASVDCNTTWKEMPY
ncbi:receptor-type tyrosine-protein phosphatase V-like [Spea bombifrons]|uniref:receptor-type tyrosine-protein phosphatase V-like n=1 Tax=Spea bombifrons TaxID=233779 RepID=UPI00234AD422|nr:receptor-type tyrosine-protein phosphatase V-like [Spea bombifrons]